MGLNRIAYLSGAEADQPVPVEELAQKRVLVFLADGFEDAEVAVLIDVLGWTRYRSKTTSITVEVAALHEVVHGAFGTCFKADVLAVDVDMGRYDALVFPGGFHNLGFDEAYCEEVRQLARAAHSLGLPIATMCVGALPVAESGVLEGRNATTYALSSRHDNVARLEELGCSVAEEPFVVDGEMVSCAGPAQAEDVAYELVRQLAGSQTVAEVAKYRRGMR